MKCEWCDEEFDIDDEAMLVIEGQIGLSSKSDRLILDNGLPPKYFHTRCLYEVALQALELDDEYLSQVGANVREMLKEEIRNEVYAEMAS